MAIPALEIEITADSKGAEVAFGRVSKALGGVEQATDDYKRELTELQRAEARGLVTKKQAAAALKQIEDRYEAAARDAAAYAGASIRATRSTTGLGGALGGLNLATRGPAGGIQNVAFQVGDFATQVGAGTSASVALGQQLPQLLGGFGALGAVMGAAVAIGVPLAASLIDLGDNAEDAADTLDRLKSISDTLNQTFDIMTADVDDLRAKYGEAAESVRQYAIELASLQLNRANDALRDQVGIVQDIGSAYYTTQDAGRDYRNTLDRIQKDFGLSRDAAEDFEAAVSDMASAQTIDEASAAAERFKKVITDAGIPIAELPDDFQTILENLLEVNIQAAELEAIMSRVRAEAAGVNIGGFGPSPVDQGGNVILPPIDDGDGGRRRGGGGRAREDRIGALARSLMTESELVETWRVESLEKLADFNALELEALGGHNEAKLRLEEEYQSRLSEINQREVALRTAAIKEYTGIAGSILSSFASMQDAQNKKEFERQKKLRKAAAIIEGIGAIVAGYRTGMERGGPPLAVAYAAQAAAATAAQVSAISRATYQGGGSIGGSTATAAAPAPLEVRLSGISADTIISGADLGGLLDRLNEEAGDRGTRLTIAT